MRSALSLPYALFLLVLVASIGVASLSISSQLLTVQTAKYHKYQLRLLERSALEIVILWLLKDRCRSEWDYETCGAGVEDVNITNVSINNETALDLRFKNAGINYDYNLSIWKTNPHGDSDINGTVIIDMVGRVALDGAEPIVITTRTAQRP